MKRSNVLIPWESLTLIASAIGLLVAHPHFPRLYPNLSHEAIVLWVVLVVGTALLATGVFLSAALLQYSAQTWLDKQR
jgi:hypothetical protein